MQIQRLKKDALEQRGDQAYYQGKLFDGLAYILAGDAVTQIESYQAGRCLGPYQDPDFTLPADALRVRFDSLIPDHEDYEEPYTYQGKRFSGIAYRFNGNYCDSQSLLADGEAIKTMEWLQNGILAHFTHTREQFQEYAVCYPSGQLNHLKLDMKDHFSLELKLTADQALSSLILNGDFFAQATQVASEFHFFPISSKEMLSTWPAAPRLFLAGSAVDNSVFQQLQTRGCFKTLQHLCLYQTQVTGNELQKLTQYPQLQKLEIVEKGSELKAISTQIKSQRPDLLVDYEGEA